MFCDELKINLKAGNGGDGCVSFRREKFVPMGGPNGGDGGRGGNITIQATKDLNTLNHLAHQLKYKGGRGGHGLGKNMTGACAEHLIIKVPRGTIVFDENRNIIADLKKDGDKIQLVKGGKGGLGNARFKTSTHQAPRFAEIGEPGEEMNVILELKLVADVGIIGFPSAGKSTLISTISNAKPKIAAYHFTTLQPNLGIVDMQRFGGSKEQDFIVADIPGLIEGASEGKGLGLKFLKHISRNKILIHMIDGLEDDVVERYLTINKELANFSSELAKVKQIIVINKSDSIPEKDLEEKVTALKKASKSDEIFVISAATRTGLKELMFKTLEELAIANKEIARKEEELANSMSKEITVLKPHIDNKKFEITLIEEVDGKNKFHVTGKRLEQIAIMTSITEQEGLERIYHYLSTSGIQKALERKGILPGEKIVVGKKEIPYRK